MRCTCKRCGREFEYSDDVGYSTDLCGPLCDGLWTGSQQRAKLQAEVRRDVAKLRGREATIRRLLEEVRRLTAIVSRLPRDEDVELAIRANNMGGLEFREDYCQCDPSVGQSPCPYCAIDSALGRLWRAISQMEIGHGT